MPTTAPGTRAKDLHREVPDHSLRPARHTCRENAQRFSGCPRVRGASDPHRVVARGMRRHEVARDGAAHPRRCAPRTDHRGGPRSMMATRRSAVPPPDGRIVHRRVMAARPGRPLARLDRVVLHLGQRSAALRRLGRFHDDEAPVHLDGNCKRANVQHVGCRSAVSSLRLAPRPAGTTDRALATGASRPSGNVMSMPGYRRSRGCGDLLHLFEQTVDPVGAVQTLRASARSRRRAARRPTPRGTCPNGQDLRHLRMPPPGVHRTGATTARGQADLPRSIL